MANATVVADDVMQEMGITSPADRRLVAQLVADVTIDLLSQNEGRFTGLEKTQPLSIVTTSRTYKLNPDFNTAKKTFYEIGDDGNFSAECMVEAKSAIHRRIVEGRYAGDRIGYIQFLTDGEDGRGDYLVLADDPTEDKTYEFDYYRQPTGNDTDVIKNAKIVKTGVKGELPIRINPDAQTDLVVYLKMREGFKENPEKRQGALTTMPPRRTAKRNQRMHYIGGGK